VVIPLVVVEERLDTEAWASGLRYKKGINTCGNKEKMILMFW
jgi:hypothetical protein